MKTRIFMRIAKTSRGKVKVVASVKPSYSALEVPNGYRNMNALPTVAFAIDMEIPDSEFSSASRLLEIKLKEVKPAVEIKEATI